MHSETVKFTGAQQAKPYIIYKDTKNNVIGSSRFINWEI
jgi:hypothetical protein